MNVSRQVCLLGLGLIAACDSDSVGGPTNGQPGAALDVQVRQVIQGWGVVPLLPVAPQNAAMVDLGRALFFDKALSGNRDVACATCHNPLTEGGDARSLAIGTGAVMAGGVRALGPGRQFTPRNAPSLFNAGLGQFYMFWDGRVNEIGGPGRFAAPTGVTFPGTVTSLLAAQAMLPVTNRVEMRGDPGDKDIFGNTNELAVLPDTGNTAIWKAVMQRVLSYPDYVNMFNAAYPGVPKSLLGFEHAANAIATFERQAFAKTNTAFDRYLQRDDNALTLDAKRGALLFFGRGMCSTCHNGPLLGGQQFANVGIPQIGPGTGSAMPLDAGREDAFGGGVQPPNGPFFQFRVPPLRNVELSAPYMHNGAYPTLEAVVRHYSNVDSAQKSYDVTQLEPALRSTYHGDATTTSKVLTWVDGRLRQPLHFTTEEQRELVAFLKSLTDPSARELSGVAPASVPSGLPVRD
jgi:cytochrome c peroxidase